VSVVAAGSLILLVLSLIAVWLIVRPILGGFHPNLRAIRVDRLPPDGEVEMELSNGHIYRSAGGHWWTIFPDGTKPSVGMDLWLNEEFDRVENINRWSETKDT